MNIDITEKVIVITGASKGIGRMLAKAFAREGAIVVINYCNSKKEAEEIFEYVRRYSPKSLMVKADVTKPDEVAQMYKLIIKELSKVDVLINNAGICSDNLINMMTYEQWCRTIEVNLSGIFLCCKEFSKIMIKQRKGKIINISSLKGIEGSAGQVNYSASKSGIIGFTKSLAKELGAFNISVNAICPGFIVTNLNNDNKRKEIIAERQSVLPTNNIANELINFLIYLSSDYSTCTSGRIFNIDSRINNVY